MLPNVLLAATRTGVALLGHPSLSVPLPPSPHPHPWQERVTHPRPEGHHGDTASLWLLLSHPVILQEALESSAGLEQLSLWTPGHLPRVLPFLESSWEGAPGLLLPSAAGQIHGIFLQSCWESREALLHLEPQDVAGGCARGSVRLGTTGILPLGSPFSPQPVGFGGGTVTSLL